MLDPFHVMQKIVRAFPDEGSAKREWAVNLAIRAPVAHGEPGREGRGVRRGVREADARDIGLGLGAAVPPAFAFQERGDPPGAPELTGRAVIGGTQ